MRHLALLGLLLAGCGRTTVSTPAQPSPGGPGTRVIAAVARPTLAPAHVATAEAGADLDEQLAAQTMFCVDTGHDCPSGFTCSDGACVAAP